MQRSAESYIDPVCGMTVAPDSPLRHDYQGQTYLFCARSCLERFRAEPQKFLAAPAAAPMHAETDRQAIFTCPMHPEVRQQGPGTCPLCGMALEPLEAAADEQPNPELADMQGRFWVALALTLPLV